MTIAAKIDAKRARLVAIKDRLTEIKTIAESEDEELEEETLAEIDELEQESEETEKQLGSLEKLEKNLATKAVPVSKPAPMVGEPAKTDKKFDLIPKMIAAHVVAHQERKSFGQVLSERYKDDVRVDAIIKSSVAAADTTTSGWAAELVQTEIQGFLDLLQGQSVYARIAGMSTRFNFGSNGQITIPTRTNTSKLAGAWVGQGGNIPVKQGSLSSISLMPYKLAVISCFTKELSRQSTPQIESIIRAAVLADTAEALDGSFLDDGAAVSGVRPAGLLNGVTATASAGTSAANIATDLKAALGPLIAANSMGMPVWLMHENIALALMTVTAATGEYLYRGELSQGTLLGYPVVRSTNVPDNTLTVVDANALATAMGVPEVDVSDTATVVMANADGSAPTHALDGAGAVGTAEQVLADGGIDVVPASAVTAGGGAGYTAQSMFQTWSTAVRMVLPISYGKLRSGIVGQVDSIAW